MSAMGRKTGTAVFTTIAVTVLSGCTSGSRQTGPPPTPTAPGRVAAGVIAGIVDVCAGPPAVSPRPATVRVLQGGVAVVSARVVAGDRSREHYRVTVAPGHYRVVASNWPQVRHLVTVHAASESTVDFPNFCE